MTSTPPISTAPPNRTDDSDNYKIGVHFGYPRDNAALVEYVAGNHPFVIVAIASSLQMVLSGAGILRDIEGHGIIVSSDGDLTEGTLGFATSDKTKAVDLTKELLTRCGLLGPFTEIAHADEDEGLWRLLYSLNPTGPYERYYDEEHIAARADIVARFCRLGEKVRASIGNDNQR